MRKVLIANRGEIAVRIARACRDEGLSSVAVYAEPELEAMHVGVADEAFALGGDTPGTSYLDATRILRAAESTGADTVHPGYGFLAEDADFAEAVIAAGLCWVGPPPAVLRAVGDKLAARRVAARVGAPLAPGSDGPVSGPEEVAAFAAEHGFPVAVKPVHRGGGRGVRVARTAEEIAEVFASAASGHGECFVERSLDRPRHVETQCLADRDGHVVVVSTRDATVQRRHQKLVEEAPAPFLTDAQREQLHTASKAVLVDVGYEGAATCEFLLGADGEVCFLGVNACLQADHPVAEQVTGIDLVREQFRIARGEPLGYDDPEVRGHAVGLRVYGENPCLEFIPSPGTVAAFAPPSGPGVRVDSGVQCGSVVGAAWDSLLAKLVVSGATRTEALQRAARALDEFVVTGVPTVLPFHRAVVADPAFARESLRVHTRWIETDFEPPITAGDIDVEETPETAGPDARQRLVVEIDNRRFEITVPADLGRGPIRPALRPRRRGRQAIKE